MSDAAGCRPPISWPLQFTWIADAKSALFEAVGLLLPFLILPTKLTHRRVHLHVDNMALVWAWKKRRMKNDALTSIILRTLHILEAALPCKIYISHLPRVSTAAAKLPTILVNYHLPQMKIRILTHPNPTLPKVFQDWLAAPSCDWSLPQQIVLAL